MDAFFVMGSVISTMVLSFTACENIAVLIFKYFLFGMKTMLLISSNLPKNLKLDGLKPSTPLTGAMLRHRGGQIFSLRQCYRNHGLLFHRLRK